MNQSAELACFHYSKGKLVEIEAIVFGTILLLGILLLLGALRQRAHDGTLSFLLFLVYTNVPQAISYTMGLMKSAPFTHELFPVWAAMLLFAYGSADNMNAHTVEESQSTSKFMWGFIIQFFWFTLLFVKTTGAFLGPLVCLVFLMFIKAAERGVALTFASRTPGVEAVTMRLAEYMKTEHELASDVPDPTTMRGYSYLVSATDVKVKYHKITKGITVKQIWECKGRLLSSTGGDPDGLLKDTCLSFSLFWLLLRKFGGYPLYESLHEKTWNFVNLGLLSKEDEPERAFRVIEEELSFLFDYFYTKYFGYYYNKYVIKLPYVVFVLLFASLSAYSLMKYKPEQDNVTLLYQNYDVDVVVTWILVVTIVVLEIIQLCLLVTSKWFQVTMLCYYVKKEVWMRTTKIDRCIEKAVEIICCLPRFARMCKPWQRRLGQYSLLDSYRSVLNNFAVQMLQTYLKIPIATWSRKELDSEALTLLLKKAVVLALKKNGRRLTNGINSLRRNGVENLSGDYCNFETKTQLVLVWHVATTLCEIHSKQSHSPSKKATEDDFHVATTLSRYCAYLAAKAPKLLPDHGHNCKHIYNTAILDAKRLLKECNSQTKIYNKMVVEGIGEEEDGGIVLRRGALLGRKLIYEIEEGEQRWKVLADFWAELILFLAPSNDELAHAEYLANGGEFITHLWALLIHAGILTREEFTAPVTTCQVALDHTSSSVQMNEMPARSGAFRRINTV